jgi:hypothetical protein
MSERRSIHDSIEWGYTKSDVSGHTSSRKGDKDKGRLIKPDVLLKKIEGISKAEKNFKISRVIKKFKERIEKSLQNPAILDDDDPFQLPEVKTGRRNQKRKNSFSIAVGEKKENQKIPSTRRSRPKNRRKVSIDKSAKSSNKESFDDATQSYITSHRSQRSNILDQKSLLNYSEDSSLVEVKSQVSMVQDVAVMNLSDIEDIEKTLSYVQNCREDELNQLAPLILQKIDTSSQELKTLDDLVNICSEFLGNPNFDHSIFVGDFDTYWVEVSRFG